ncbi:HD domain-containing protein [Amycolatopsis jejuensis]|uniref:HD domain-containing protein n=1 Tax=Amycolatopsis jejuensis TaxID=330084 RepID=UPI000AC29096|nr:HD domain-containing protein [Amycolatopsis jejuensis]
MSDSQARIEAAAERALATTAHLDINDQADAAEDAMAEELGKLASKSVIYTSGEEDPTTAKPFVQPPDRVMLMDEDPRLRKMPANPTLLDFFKYRFRPSQQHLLQSAALAQENGCSEKVVLACLLHDISVVGFIRADHGYWGAQLIEPYVDEEVSWAVRYHQALRFFPDDSVGYEYPEAYVRFFGSDFTPSREMQEAHDYARAHKWYMSSRLVTMNDLYAFDPDKKIDVERFADVIGRNFRQPPQGLGMDNSPSAHMWRTIIAPTRFL